MNNRTEMPIYSQIAFDIALKISHGELKEGAKITGRSLLVSEYGTSSETIRRALRILADAEIVDISERSVAAVLSKSKAIDYVSRFEINRDIRTLRAEIGKLMEEDERIRGELTAKLDQILNLSERLKGTEHFYVVEFLVPPESPIIGKTIFEVQFRQKTGATVVAIKREGRMILSPSPDERFHVGDVILVAGMSDTSEKIDKLISGS
jgi:K+/H+ antiporter YhaU regulatory subunit KhtT